MSSAVSKTLTGEKAMRGFARRSSFGFFPLAGSSFGPRAPKARSRQQQGRRQRHRTLHVVFSVFRSLPRAIVRA